MKTYEIVERDILLNMLEKIRKTGDISLLDSLELLLREKLPEISIEESELLRLRTELADLNVAINQAALLAYTDTSGCIIEVNEKFLSKTGYTSKELKGQNMSVFDAGKHTLEFYNNLWQTISAGEIWRGEVAKKTKTGEILWLKTSIVPIKNETGEITRFISLYVDISERKRIEEELELFLGLLNFSNDAIQVAAVGGRLVYVNGKFISNLGFTKEELLQKNVWELGNFFNGPDQWNDYIEDVKKHPDGKLSEGINVRKDGSSFPVESNVKYFEQGNEAYIISVIRDISERRLSESAMVHTKKQLTEAQDIARICSYEIDFKSGKGIWSANAAEVFGIPEIPFFSNELLKTFINPTDLDRITSLWEDSAITGEKFDLEYKLQVPGSEIQYMHCVNHPQRNELGVVVRFIGTVQNITDSVLARNKLRNYTFELEKRNKELDQFAQIVSHDLKAPLRAIHSITEWIQEENPGLNDEMTRQIELLRRRVERMEYLINGILNYSGAGRIKESQSTFSSKTSIIEIVEAGLYADKVRITLGSLPTITEDKFVFEQVIGNLVSNAVKHNNAEHKEVHIYSETESDAVVFVVKDNGPGIPSGYHEKIFRIFQTLLPRDKMENTGVGLAIVKKLCDNRKWRITLHSEEGQGASFRVSIPFHK